MCSCVSIGTHEYVHMEVRGQTDLGTLSQVLSVFVFVRGSVYDLGLLGWLAGEPKGSSCSCLCSNGIAGEHHICLLTWALQTKFRLSKHLPDGAIPSTCRAAGSFKTKHTEGRGQKENQTEPLRQYRQKPWSLELRLHMSVCFYSLVLSTRARPAAALAWKASCVLSSLPRFPTAS